MERPFSSSRPVGPFIDLQSRSFSNDDINLTKIREPQDDIGDSIQQIVDAVDSGNICSVAEEYSREILVPNPNQNTEKKATVIKDPGKLLVLQINEKMQMRTDRISSGEVLISHRVQPSELDTVLDEGLKSRSELGFEPRFGSELRNSSAFFHGNSVSMSRSAVSSDPTSDTIHIIYSADIEDCLWGSPTIAQGLAAGSITPEEYREYGVVDYKTILQCAASDEFSRSIGTFFPYKLDSALPGVPQNNIDEFKEESENFVDRHMSMFV